MENPAFTVEFDVTQGASYGSFISDVRNQLVVHAVATRHLELVLLRPQEDIRFRSVGGALAHMMCNASRRGVLPAHMVKQVKNWGSLSVHWLGAVLYGQPFKQPFEPIIEADGSRQYDYIPQDLLAPAKIDCQDHAMMALGVALNLQGELKKKHKEALKEHWRAVDARARKLDRERASTSSR